jgi:cell division septum initiation protein DivIVA
MLAQIQAELKAPKGNFNSFGKYKYRSCEDIVEAVKPLLADHRCHLILTDDVVAVLDRVYVKATATIYKGTEIIGQSTAFAREALDKKGMDDSQITGTASSYARKYALNGLLAIDDTKDADTDEDTAKRSTPEPKPAAKIEESVRRAIHACTDIDELRTVWRTLTKEQRDAHAEIIEEVQERLA